MSILLLEGFDDGLWTDRVTGLITGNVGSSYGLHGDGARVGDVPGEKFTVGVPTGEKFVIGFAFKIVTQGPVNARLVYFNAAFNTMLQYDSGRLHLHCSGSATSDIDWYSDVGSVAVGDWHYVEIELEHGSASDGSLKWWLDGNELNSTTTHDYTIALDSTMQVGGDSSSDIDDAYIDDLYVCDATGSVNDTALGPIEIVDLYPSGNGNTSGLTGSDGNSTDNYLLVDENPPSSTDYVGSDTEGDKDTYAMGDLTDTPVVVGVVAALYAAKTDTGAKWMRPVLRTSSTDYNGDSEALSESYALHEHAWDQDPNTSATWLYGAVNGMEVGQEVRDS